MNGMAHKSKRNVRNPGNRGTRFPGICAAASALGVNRIHLYLVLSGQRESRRLMARWNDLNKTEKNEEQR